MSRAEDYLRVLSHNIETGADAFHGLGQVTDLWAELQSLRPKIAWMKLRIEEAMNDAEKRSQIAGITAGLAEKRNSLSGLTGLGLWPFRQIADLVQDKVILGVPYGTTAKTRVRLESLEKMAEERVAAGTMTKEEGASFAKAVAEEQAGIHAPASVFASTFATEVKERAGRGLDLFRKVLPYVALGGIALIGLTYLAPTLKRKRA